MLVKLKKKYVHKSKTWQKGEVKNIDATLARKLEKKGVLTIQTGETRVEKGISEEDYKSPLKSSEEEE